MTPRQIAALAVRLFSLYALYSALNYVATAISTAALFSSPGTLPAGASGVLRAQAIQVLAHLLMLAGFAIFLWIFADGLAAMMVKDSSEASAEDRMSAFQLQSVTFTSIGLFTVIQACGQLINGVASLVTLRQFIGSPDDMKVRAALISTFMLLLFGLWLLFGARGFIKLLHSARNVGRDPEFVATPHSE